MSKLKSAFVSKPTLGAGSFDIVAATNAVDSEVSLDPAAGSFSVGLEHFDNPTAEHQADFRSVYEALERSLGGEGVGFESFVDNNRPDSARVSENALFAAALANVGYGNELSYRRACQKMTSVPASDDPTIIAVKPSFDGPFGSIGATTVATENYNEKSQRDFRVVSAMYNLSAARQDPFAEAAYPTVVVNPTEGGVTQNVTYIAVMQDKYHETTGALLDNDEVNMVEAYRDPSILEDKSNLLYPVVAKDDSNKHLFSTLVTPSMVEDDHGIQLDTAPLKVNQGTFNLIGVSNFALLKQSNLLDISDTIDTAMRLKYVYLKASDTQAIRFMTERLPSAVFVPALVGDTRKANLNFSSQDLLLKADTTTVDKTAHPALAEIASRGWTVHLAVSVSGSVSLSRGETDLMASAARVSRVISATGEKLSLNDPAVKSVVDALGGLEVDSVVLDARFTNTNRRKRGQLIQTRTYQFRYPIPMLSPITCPMSTMDEGGPGEVVKALTVGVNIRNSANAVTRMLNYVAQLRDVTTAGLNKPSFERIEGALSIMMRPTYRYQALHLPDAIDTIRSKDRWEDTCSTILNTVRSMLYPAYRDSNIEAAFRTVTGNADEKPKFIILTDQEIGHYLMTKGDPRALGAYFDFEVVTTNNINFDGKLLVIPTRKTAKEDDILNWGQFYYVPTIIADLPIARNGQISREIAAIPFNLHINNIPFALELDITGLKDVMGTSNFTSKVGQTTTPEEENEAPAPEPTP